MLLLSTKMESNYQIKKDLETLQIVEGKNITIKYVTMKYKKLAKERHPDKDGGSTDNFQELQTAFRRIVEYLEEINDEEEDDDNFEAEFFMKNNIMKECTASFVVYIQEALVSSWKIVFQRNLSTRRMEKGKIIYRIDELTITLYEKPKKDPRSKLHIQSRSQNKNLGFIMDNLATYYQEVCSINNDSLQSLKLRWLEKAQCGECGKQLMNKKGLKLHIVRIHQKKIKKAAPTLALPPLVLT